MGPEKEFKKRQCEGLMCINTRQPQGRGRVRTLRCWDRNAKLAAGRHLNEKTGN